MDASLSGYFASKRRLDVFALFDAGGTYFKPVSARKSGPLEIRVSPRFACRIVFASQKVSLGRHRRAFAASWTLFHIYWKLC